MRGLRNVCGLQNPLSMPDVHRRDHLTWKSLFSHQESAYRLLIRAKFDARGLRSVLCLPVVNGTAPEHAHGEVHEFVSFECRHASHVIKINLLVHENRRQSHERGPQRERGVVVLGNIRKHPPLPVLIEAALALFAEYVVPKLVRELPHTSLAEGNWMRTLQLRSTHHAVHLLRKVMAVTQLLIFPFAKLALADLH